MHGPWLPQYREKMNQRYLDLTKSNSKIHSFPFMRKPHPLAGPSLVRTRPNQCGSIKGQSRDIICGPNARIWSLQLPLEELTKGLGFLTGMRHRNNFV